MALYWDCTRIAQGWAFDNSARSLIECNHRMSHPHDARGPWQALASVCPSGCRAQAHRQRAHWPLGPTPGPRPGPCTQAAARPPGECEAQWPYHPAAAHQRRARRSSPMGTTIGPIGGHLPRRAPAPPARARPTRAVGPPAALCLSPTSPARPRSVQTLLQAHAASRTKWTSTAGRQCHSS